MLSLYDIDYIHKCMCRFVYVSCAVFSLCCVQDLFCVIADVVCHVP